MTGEGTSKAVTRHEMTKQKGSQVEKKLNIFSSFKFKAEGKNIFKRIKK